MDPRVLVGIGVAVAGVALAAYLIYQWSRLKDWASRWLSCHPKYKKVVCDIQCATVECAAAVSRGAKKFVLPVFGIDNSGRRVKIVSEEEISVDQIDGLKKKIRENPVLAICA